MRLSSFYVFFLTVLFAHSVLAADATDQAKTNEFSLGVEGFYDRYREPEPDVTVSIDYGSVTGGWTHYWNMFGGSFLMGFDGRYSHGTDNYRSPSGDLSGVPEDEYEARIFTGIRIRACDQLTTSG